MEQQNTWLQRLTRAYIPFRPWTSHGLNKDLQDFTLLLVHRLARFRMRDLPYCFHVAAEYITLVRPASCKLRGTTFHCLQRESHRKQEIDGGRDYGGGSSRNCLGITQGESNDQENAQPRFPRMSTHKFGYRALLWLRPQRRTFSAAEHH